MHDNFEFLRARKILFSNSWTDLTVRPNDGKDGCFGYFDVRKSFLTLKFIFDQVRKGDTMDF